MSHTQKAKRKGGSDWDARMRRDPMAAEPPPAPPEVEDPPVGDGDDGQE